MMTAKDVLIALSVVMIAATNLIFQKFVVGELSVFIVSFLRCALIAPLIFFFPRPQKKLIHYVICGLFWSVLYLLIFGFGIKSQMGTGMASFFLQTQVFFAILCCYFLLGEKIQIHQLLGILLASLGIFLLSSNTALDNISLEGIVLLLASCLCWGVGFALLKKYKIGSTISDVVWLSAIAAVPLLVVVLVVEGAYGAFEQIALISGNVWMCVIFGAYASTLLCTYLWFGVVQRVTAATATPFMLLLPIFSVTLSYIFMGEIPTGLQVIAGTIILLGVMVSQNLHLYAYHFLRCGLLPRKTSPVSPSSPSV